MFDVNVTIRIRIHADGELQAERRVLDLLDMHLGDMLGNHNVIETGVPLTATNPHATEVK